VAKLNIQNGGWIQDAGENIFVQFKISKMTILQKTMFVAGQEWPFWKIKICIKLYLKNITHA
jgi:hypothetical protein